MTDAWQQAAQRAADQARAARAAADMAAARRLRDTDEKQRYIRHRQYAGLMGCQGRSMW